MLRFTLHVYCGLLRSAAVAVVVVVVAVAAAVQLLLSVVVQGGPKVTPHLIFRGFCACVVWRENSIRRSIRGTV